MLLLIFLVCWCQVTCVQIEGNNTKPLTGFKKRWYGPSYQPRWWSSNAVTLKSDDFHYDGANENVSFRSGAFEGSIIGLSIGIVLGSIRAISLDGVPHSEDETPCKTLVSHIVGGLISGALIGLVYVFLKECLLK